MSNSPLIRFFGLMTGNRSNRTGILVDIPDQTDWTKNFDLEFEFIRFWVVPGWTGPVYRIRTAVLRTDRSGEKPWAELRQREMDNDLLPHKVDDDGGWSPRRLLLLELHNISPLPLPLRWRGAPMTRWEVGPMRGVAHCDNPTQDNPILVHKSIHFGH
jgi:hypothetical protein